MLFALCSCGNSIDPDPAESSQQVVTNNTLYNIKSKMDASTYENCSVELSNLMNTINTRSSDAISDSAQIYLKPFVNDGKTIQKEILSQLSKDSEEYKYYQSLNDEQLASLSWCITLMKPQFLGLELLSKVALLQRLELQPLKTFPSKV